MTTQDRSLQSLRPIFTLPVAKHVEMRGPLYTLVHFLGVAAIMSLLHAGRAQDTTFVVPGNWRKPTSNLTLEQRNSLVEAVIESLRPLFNASTGLIDSMRLKDCCSLFTAISWLDYMSGTKRYQELVMSNFNVAASQQHLIYQDDDSDRLALGLASYRVWKAYGSTSALDSAISVWEEAYTNFVQPSDAAQGLQTIRNVTISGTCNGATTAGGVFYQLSGSGTTDTVVNAETVGPFTALSTYLYGATANATYSSAAELSAEFIWSHLYNGTIIVDGITLANCETSGNPADILSYNYGTVSEALAALSQLNSIWTPRLNALLSSAIPFPVWTSVDNGINIEEVVSPTQDLQYEPVYPIKAMTIRGLYAAWNQSTPNSNVANYIQTYINVQMNALLDLSSGAGSTYGNWQGPPVSTVVPWAQLCALEVFRAAVGFALSSPPSGASAPTSSPSPAGSYRPSSRTTLSKGAVAGVAVGGSAALFLILALVLFVLKRKKQHYEEKQRKIMEFTPVPYQTAPDTSKEAYEPNRHGLDTLSSTAMSAGLSSTKKRKTSRDPVQSASNTTTEAGSPVTTSSAHLLPEGASLVQSAAQMHSAGLRQTQDSTALTSGVLLPTESGAEARAGPFLESPLQAARLDNASIAVNFAAVRGILSELNRTLTGIRVEDDAPPEYES